MFTESIHLNYFKDLFSSNKEKAVREIIKSISFIEQELISQFLEFSILSSSPPFIKKLKKYSKYLVKLLEQVNEFYLWMKEKDFDPHDMAPFEDKLIQLSNIIIDENRITHDRINSQRNLTVSFIAIIISVSAIIISILFHFVY